MIAITSKFAKAQAARGIFQYKIDGGGRITFTGNGPGGISFAAVQMKQLGDFAIETVKDRVAKGVGSDDAAMPALSTKRAPIFLGGKFVGAGGYAGAKTAAGGQPIRNLYGPGTKGSGPWAKGHMLDNLSVRKVSDTQVQIGFSTDWARGKARANEQRSPWFQFSGGDAAKIYVFSRTLFEAAVKDFAAGRRGFRLAASSFAEAA